MIQCFIGTPHLGARIAFPLGKEKYAIPAISTDVTISFQFSGGWWNGRVSRRSQSGASNGKARIDVRAFHTKLERRIQPMILLLVKIRSFAGRLTALIVWTRKGRR
jgi:hypothetical protein